MVTEELHSITFETQICLYGLTIDLEVGVNQVFTNNILVFTNNIFSHRLTFIDES